MPPKVSNRAPKRGVKATEAAELPAKRRHKPTQRLLESQRQLTPPPTQPSQPTQRPSQPTQRLSQPSQRLLSPIEPPLSPLPQASPPIDPLLPASPALEEEPWETQVRDNRPASALLALEEGSVAATEAFSEPGNSVGALFDGLADDFTGLDWRRLPGLMKPLAQSSRKKSWVYRHGYRTVTELPPHRVFFICHICYQRRAQGSGKYDVTNATTSAANHLLTAHRITVNGEVEAPVIANGQRSLRQMLTHGQQPARAIANTMGNFDVQGFRMAAVSWLISNNHPLREFETPEFRQIIEFANPEAARALWASHNSVSRFVMKVYAFMQPQVAKALSDAVSKIHISFDGWTA